MNIIGGIIGIVITLSMLVMYGAAALQALEIVLRFILSPMGIIAIQIFMLVAVVYFISKNIKDAGVPNTLKSIFFCSEKLYISFWVYFMSLRIIISDASSFLVSRVHEAASVAIIINIALFYLLGFSTIITAFKAKSFILWKGLAIVAVAGLLSLNTLGMYIAFKEGTPLAEIGYANDISTDETTTHKNDLKLRINDWQKLVENILG